MISTRFSRTPAPALIAAGVLLACGCAGRGGPVPPREPAPAEETETKGRTKAVRLPGQDRYLPSEDPRNQPPAGRTTIVMPETVTIGPERTAEEPQPAPPAPPVPEEPEACFRVQILATVSQEKAERLQGAITAALGEEEPVVIEREGGIWKVQVGAAKEPNAAQSLRRRLVGIGYEDAFIVDCNSR